MESKTKYNLILDRESRKKPLYYKSTLTQVENESLQDSETEVEEKIPPKDLIERDFIALIVGKQGYGKSTLISSLLTTNNLLKKKFHYILWNTPSKVPGFQRDEEFWNDKIDLTWFKDRLERISLAAIEKAKDVYVLWVLDDSIAQVFSGKNTEAFLDIIIRRRHLYPNVNISILFTTQYYKLFPKKYRSMLNYLILFHLNGDDLNDIQKEILGNTSKNSWATDLIKSHWRTEKHNFIFINLLSHFFSLNWSTVFDI